ncbi:uncharacterized protein LOC725992 isoform X2 [Apis mellifera]|uniref:Uncharacterized protein LOC725992 isoform X2 n=1 Tax=Apis mellifera TaxID=7460 RepID=A0A7M7LQZ0_APIME|nr:uncharacterized protein LOC725992 isoform X2 [Apis mellifera]|eukprot:XP_006562053.1 uncharacterized protein LOC725992 isoform X2 [Apis mellifera]
MLLYVVLRTALSISFGAIVQILIFLLQNSNILKVQAFLPPGAEDEIILIEHLPGRRVHLQDFFWSDAKDAPPWIDQGLTFYETKTVYHTVTLYSPAEDKDKPPFPDQIDSTEPKCITCIEPTPRLDSDEDQNIGILIGEDPGPRYWLLTVLRAGETIPPKIELKLARLYKTAFLRQQQRHLGLLQTDTRLRRITRGHALIKTKSEIADQNEIYENPAISPTKLRIQTNSEAQISTMPNSIKLVQVSTFNNTLLQTSNVNDIENHSEMDNFYLKRLSLIKDKKNVSTTTTSIDFNENITNYTNQHSLENNISFNLSSMMHNLQDYGNNYSVSEQEISNNVDGKNISNHSKLRLLDRTGEETVQVRMQNTSITESGATKLIYSVHLGGKPVPAETAARDMALLSSQEVALELGAPVLIQSEPKRKRAHSAVAAPPSHHILKKKREYIQATLDNNACSTSEMEIKTEGTSQRQTLGSLSRTPVSIENADSLEAEIHEVSSDDDEQKSKVRESSSWEHSLKKSRLIHGRMSRTNAIDTPQTSDSTDVIVDHLDSLENNYTKQEEATASPYSYLSMPSCKAFPSMKNVEPLSRVLEPVMVKHLDIDSPKEMRREKNHFDVYKDDEDKFFARTSSAIKDPGVIGPIVWNLRKQNLSAESNDTLGTEIDSSYIISSGPVGKARKRLHELLEDSFSLFGSRDQKPDVQLYTTQSTSIERVPDTFTIFSETKERSIHASPISSPLTEMHTRPRTSLLLKYNTIDNDKIAENGHFVPSRNNWGSRPLSAGPFHKPNLPIVNSRRILTDCQLPQEDPAVPLIASIKKELEKFSSQ